MPAVLAGFLLLISLLTSGCTETSIVHHGRLDAGVQLVGKPFKRQLARKVDEVLRAEGAETGEADSNRVAPRSRRIDQLSTGMNGLTSCGAAYDRIRGT